LTGLEQIVRTGLELEALLDEMELGWRDVWNVVNGGLAMRLTSIRLIPVGLALVGVLGGTAISLAIPDRYPSTAILRLSATEPQAIRQLLNGTFGPGSHSGAGREHASWMRVAVDRRSPAPKDGATTLVVASADEDAAKAQRVTQQLVDVVAKALEARTASSAHIRLETITAPKLPTSPSGPNRAALAASGGAAGLFLGAIVAWFRRGYPRQA
jgi:hypothetical protein